MMKALLQFDVGQRVRDIIASAQSPALAVEVVPELDEIGFRTALRDADMLLHVLKPVTRETFADAPRLRLVQKIGIGVDTIDLLEAASHNVAVCNMPGTNTQAVVELTLGLLFACLRQIPQFDRETRGGRGWTLPPQSYDGLREISGSTVGLVGYGAVGRRLAPVLRTLGANVIACDPAISNADIEMLPLDAVLKRSDIVSLHLPSTPQTNNLLNAGRLAMMRRGAIVINAARGALIDTAALIDALKSGQLAAAGLDVFAVEPLPVDDPVLSLPNVVLTPHVAWLTEGTWRRSMDVIVENCSRLAADKPLLHRVA